MASILQLVMGISLQERGYPSNQSLNIRNADAGYVTAAGVNGSFQNPPGAYSTPDTTTDFPNVVWYSADGAGPNANMFQYGTFALQNSGGGGSSVFVNASQILFFVGFRNSSNTGPTTATLTIDIGEVGDPRLITAASTFTASTPSWTVSMASGSSQIQITAAPVVANPLAILVNSSKPLFPIQNLTLTAGTGPEGNLMGIQAIAFYNVILWLTNVATQPAGTLVDITGGGYPPPIAGYGAVTPGAGSPPNKGFTDPTTSTPSDITTSWGRVAGTGLATSSVDATALIGGAYLGYMTQRFYIGTSAAASVTIPNKDLRIFVPLANSSNEVSLEYPIVFEVPVTWYFGSYPPFSLDEWTLSSSVAAAGYGPTPIYAGLSIARTGTGGSGTCLYVDIQVSSSILDDTIPFFLRTVLGTQFEDTIGIQALTTTYNFHAPPGPTQVNLEVTTTAPSYATLPFLASSTLGQGTIVSPLTCSVNHVLSTGTFQSQIFADTYSVYTSPSPTTYASAEQLQIVPDTAGGGIVVQSFVGTSPVPMASFYLYSVRRTGPVYNNYASVTASPTIASAYALATGRGAMLSAGMTKFGAVVLYDDGGGAKTLAMEYPTTAVKADFVAAGLVDATGGSIATVTIGPGAPPNYLIETVEVSFSGVVFMSATLETDSVVTWQGILVCTFSGWDAPSPAWTLTEAPLSFTPSLIAQATYDRVLVASAGTRNFAVVTAAAEVILPPPSSTLQSPGGGAFAGTNGFVWWWGSGFTQMTAIDCGVSTSSTLRVSATVTLSPPIVMQWGPVLVACETVSGSVLKSSFVCAGGQLQNTYILPVSLNTATMTITAPYAYIGAGSYDPGVYSGFSPTSTIVGLSSLALVGASPEAVWQQKYFAILISSGTARYMLLRQLWQ
jgi:hypothetical protein